MKCDHCPKPATVHLTEIINGQKNEIHLCEDCAKEMGPAIENQFSFPGLLGKLMPTEEPKQEQKETPAAQEPECPNCGITYSEFRSKGRLGCSMDYQVFENYLVPILEKIHGASRHVGKLPSRSSMTVAKENRLIQLREDLKRSIEKEEYESAAALRDAIRKLTVGEEGDHGA